jgi:hypothetical protein
LITYSQPGSGGIIASFILGGNEAKFRRRTNPYRAISGIPKGAFTTSPVAFNICPCLRGGENLNIFTQPLRLERSDGEAAQVRPFYAEVRIF